MYAVTASRGSYAVRAVLDDLLDFLADYKE